MTASATTPPTLTDEDRAELLELTRDSAELASKSA